MEAGACEGKGRRVRIRAVAAALLLATTASARENLDTERALGEALLTAIEGDPLARSDVDRAAGIAKPRPLPERSWAVLPQVGFSPEKGANAGVKFTDRHFADGNLVLDFGGVWAIEGQQKADFTLVAPQLFRRWLIVLLEAEYIRDPTWEFFGLGNNDVGPDELSTHRFRKFTGIGTLAVRPFERVTISASLGFSDVGISDGELEDDVPSTVEEFPDLPGIDGGKVNPVSISIVFNNREEVTRPTRGWSFLGKIQFVEPWLGSDFDFTRYILDASYLLPLFGGRQVLGARVGGEFNDARIRNVPFYELASLGGSDDLRGFFLDRFIGRSRVMTTFEHRLKLVGFEFFDLWQVEIDGVGFFEAGRVFLEDGELSDQFQIDDEILPRIFEDFRYSYGGGLRIALSDAILARIDVGFSEEESALFYLTFGHTF